MDRNEAIITLRANVIYACESAGFNVATINLVTEALDLAIEALRQTESEDCISKHDLWKIIEDNAYWVTYNETSTEKGMTLTGINQALNECPPVTPPKKVVAQINIDTENLIERIKEEYEITDKVGEWIYGNGHGECSVCKHERQYGWDNYCGNCGAKMKGMDNE